MTHAAPPSNQVGGAAFISSSRRDRRLDSGSVPACLLAGGGFGVHQAFAEEGGIACLAIAPARIIGRPVGRAGHGCGGVAQGRGHGAGRPLGMALLDQGCHARGMRRGHGRAADPHVAATAAGHGSINRAKELPQAGPIGAGPAGQDAPAAIDRARSLAGIAAKRSTGCSDGQDTRRSVAGPGAGRAVNGLVRERTDEAETLAQAETGLVSCGMGTAGREGGHSRQHEEGGIALLRECVKTLLRPPAGSSAPGQVRCSRARLIENRRQQRVAGHLRGHGGQQGIVLA